MMPDAAGPDTGRANPRLVVVVGPIAAGKSTLAAEVGRRLRERGESVALVGVDEVADMALRGLGWQWAHEVHAHVVRAWLATPVDTVIAEGPGTRAELDQLMRCNADDVGALTVVTTIDYRTALARATRDPDRGLSKDPVFLRRMHDRFVASLPNIAADLTVDTARDSPATLAEQVVAALDERRAWHTST